MQVGCLFVHMYHGGENVAPAYLLLHKDYRLSEVDLDVFSAPALEELRAGGDKGVYKHGAAFSRLAARRFNSAVDLLPVSLRWLDDVKLSLLLVTSMSGLLA